MDLRFRGFLDYWLRITKSRFSRIELAKTGAAAPAETIFTGYCLDGSVRARTGRNLTGYDRDLLVESLCRCSFEQDPVHDIDGRRVDGPSRR